jgi:hypothetical protein
MKISIKHLLLVIALIFLVSTIYTQKISANSAELTQSLERSAVNIIQADAVNTLLHIIGYSFALMLIVSFVFAYMFLVGMYLLLINTPERGKIK